MKIVQITTDNRNQLGDYAAAEPHFGTAPAGLLDGFDGMPGVEVHVISCASARMRVPEMIGSNIWFHQPYVPKPGWGRSMFLGCAWSVRRLLNRIQPDIVHGQGTERDCAMAAVLSGFPNVLTIHGNMRVHAKRPEHRGSIYYKVAAALETFCLKRTDGVVAISNYTREMVEGLAKNTWLLPNAVDKRFFEVRVHPPEIPRILFVGFLDERKNPIGLIKACELMLRSGRCTIAFAGGGNPQSAYWKEFNALLETMPGLELLGFLDRGRLAAEFAKSSLLVLPTFEDNCPMVILEAMAAGLPVAAARVGGIPDLVIHETDGLMFDPRDPLDIRRAVERVVSNREFREAMVTAGRTKALQKFHPREIAQRHVEIYREILGAHR